MTKQGTRKRRWAVSLLLVLAMALGLGLSTFSTNAKADEPDTWTITYSNGFRTYEVVVSEFPHDETLDTLFTELGYKSANQTISSIVEFAGGSGNGIEPAFGGWMNADGGVRVKNSNTVGGVSGSFTNYYDPVVHPFNIWISVQKNKKQGSITWTNPTVEIMLGESVDNKLNHVGDSEVTFTIADESIATINGDENTGAVSTPVAVGQTTVTATVADTASYKYDTKTATYTLIVKDKVVATAEGYDDYYDGSAHTIKVNVTNPTEEYIIKYGTEEGSYELDEPPTRTDAGKTTVYYKVTAGDFYEPATGSADINIKPLPVKATAEGYEGYYDGNAHTITVNVTEPTSDYKIMYGLKEGTYDLEEPPTRTEVGTTTVYYQVTAGPNYDSATGSADIIIKEKPDEGQEVTITYKLNGGKYDGKTDDIIVKAYVGDIITIHEAPTRSGYTFEFWKGSEYQPGDEYTVEGDHTFVAQWSKNGSGGKKKTAKNAVKRALLPRTSDMSSVTAIAGFAFSGTLSLASGAALRTRRRRPKHLSK